MAGRGIRRAQEVKVFSVRRVGKIGESEFQKWAAEAGLTVNRAYQDETGWDFLLEFPMADHDTVPLDRHPTPLQSLVQVKSTDSNRRRRSVKLSNWVRLVRTPLPAFFLVLHFETSNECAQAFLIHVGEAWIEKVLLRLRELSDTDRITDLHKRTLDLRWSDQDALKNPDGTSLARRIADHAPDGLEAYTAEKLSPHQSARI